MVIVTTITFFTSSSEVMLYNQIMGASGLMYVFTARRNDWFFPLFGLTFASMYAYQMLGMNILGEAYFNIFISIPMLSYGLWQNRANLNIDKLHVEDRVVKYPFKLITISIGSFGLIYMALLRLGSTSLIVDSISTTFALMGTVLLNARYNKQSFIFWSLANATNLILHLTRGNYALCLIFGIYLINGLMALMQNKKK